MIIFMQLLALAPLWLLLSLTSIKNVSATSLPSKYRIVALTSLSADLISNISPEMLVGIPSSSLLRNDPYYSRLTTVSVGRNQPSIEKIIQLRPDFVVGANGFHDKTLKKLESMGLSTFSYSVDNLHSLQAFADQLSKLTSSPKLSIENRIQQCFLYHDHFRDKGNVLVLTGLKPLIAPTANSWSGSLLQHLSINNLSSKLPPSGQFKGYATLSSEWLVTNKPDSIVLVSFPGIDKVDLSMHPLLGNLPAVKSKKVYYLDYYGLINPGSLASIDNTCQRLNAINSSPAS